MEFVEPNSKRWLLLEDLPNERWADVANYEGLYQVSDYGRVRNSKRIGSQGSQRILKVKIAKNGYCSVGLSCNGIVKWFRLNRLVAKHFIPNPHNKTDVNHNDENKNNNYYKNLTWMTSEENCNYGSRNTKISEKTRVGVCQFDTNMNFVQKWSSLTQAAKSLNLPVSHISQVCKGHRKTCGGYVWKYNREVKQWNGNTMKIKQEL